MDLGSREGRREQGARIAAAAEAAGLSLAELAQAVGCSRALIYQYVAGQVLAQADRLQAIAAQCGRPLAWFYEVAPLPATPLPTGPPAESAPERELARLEALADAQAAPPDFGAAKTTAGRLVEAATRLGDPARLARAEYRLGQACHALGELEGARAAMVRAVEGFRAAGNEAHERAARQTLGAALAGLGERDRALVEFEAVIASGEFQDEWRGRLGRADVYEALGRGEAALDELAAAERLVERQPEGAARAWATLYVQAATVNVYLLHDDFAAAQAAARRCAPLAEELACVDQHLEARLNLGFARRHLLAWPGARESFDDALRLARLTGDRERAAVATACRAELWAALGRCGAARAEAQEALAAGLELGSLRVELLAHLALSEACRRAGEANEGLYHAQQAVAAAGAHGLAKLEATARIALARAWRALGASAAAATEERRAAAMAERIGARWVSAAAQLGLAHGAWVENRLETAREHLAPATKLAAETGAGELALEARTLAALVDRDAEAALAALDAWQALREALLAAEVEEAVFDDVGRLTLVRACLTLILEAGLGARAEAWLAAAAWPPLSA